MDRAREFWGPIPKTDRIQYIKKITNKITTTVLIINTAENNNNNKTVVRLPRFE